jgi:triosephosphate isomerase (TIM)
MYTTNDYCKSIFNPLLSVRMQSMKKIIVGNWKMYGDPVMAVPLIENIAIQAAKKPEGVEVVVCPPAILISEVARLLIGTDIRLGGQDCHWETEGAFTGNISPVMLKQAGCSYVIVGHSERRQQQLETCEMISRKAAAACRAGLIPIICIGETMVERDTGKAQETVGRQLADSIPKSFKDNDFILAYEPVWAIGTGRAATNDDICQMHAYIHAQSGGKVAVLYGGSVKGANAREILTNEGVSGVLVGGASLKAEEFSAIIAAVNGK